MPCPARLPALLALAAFAFPPMLAGAQEVNTSGLSAGRAVERVATIRQIADARVDSAEKLILRMLDDPDWEVVEVAAECLGRCGGRASHKPLLSLAVDGPIRRVRHAAARSLVRLDPDDGAKRLAAKVAGGRAAAAADALAAGLAGGATADLRRLERMLDDDDGGVREAIARALLRADPTPERLAALLATGDVRVAVGALEALLGTAGPEHAPPVVALLDAGASDVVERRAVALVADLCVRDLRLVDGAREAVAVLPPRAAARVGRALLAGQLEASRQKLARELADRAAAGDDPTARGLAIAVYERLGTKDGVSIASLATDPDPRVRLAAAQALGRLDPLGHAELLATRLVAEPDAAVRRGLAAALGARNRSSVLPPLTAALEDDDWGVACCAAVSIGALGARAAIEPLAELRATHADWRLRAAAATGLGRLWRAEALPPLIDALDDADAVVAACAHEALRRMTGRVELERDADAWRAWFDDGGSETPVTRPPDAGDRRVEFGHVAADAEVYLGLDVVVLEGGDDRPHVPLEREGIPHRSTPAGRLHRDGLAATSILFAACPGALARDDAEVLEWFVLCGGQVFASCQALSGTIAPVFPGVLAAADSRPDANGTVEARACAADAQLTLGVFAPGARPVCALDDAALIDVVAPERALVLIDSPAAAERFGSGVLAASFDAGHGTVVAVAGHFDAAGLAAAPGVSKPDERRAWAVDRLGLTYPQLRALDADGDEVWKTGARAAAAVPDRQAFRLVTNFVRRARGDGH